MDRTPGRLPRRVALGLAIATFSVSVAACAGSTTESSAVNSPGTQAPVPVGSGSSAPPAPNSTGIPQDDVEPIASYEVVEIHDPLINGFLALTFLVPPGWRTQGGISWDPDLYPLAGAALIISDPSNAYALETYFAPSFSWIDDPLFQNPGANWLGSIMAPPRSAADALVELVLPQVRPGAQVIGSTPVETEPVEGQTSDGVRLRVSYDTQAGPVEEEFLAITYNLTAFNAGTTFTQWGFQILYSVRAPAGELDAAMPTLEIIAASFDVDPRWYANYLTVVDLFIQRGYESIRLAAELSAYITATYEEISRIHREVWEEQQRTYDRIFDNFSDYIRGTQKVQRSNGGTTRTQQGVPCEMPDGTIVVFPHGSTCPVGSTQLPTVTN